MCVSSIMVPELACVPGAIPAAERKAHCALGRELLEVSAKERVALPNGYAIRFEPDAFEAVAHFVQNERKCCQFLSFELTLEPASGPLWLRMTGSEGTRAILDAELSLTGGREASSERGVQVNDTRSATQSTGVQCGCARTAGSTNRIVKWTTAGGVLAALGVCAACCLLPFALLSIGVTGAWVSGLDGFAAYKWPFIGLAVALLGYGFYAAYLRPKRICAAGAACDAGGSSRSVRLGLWAATILTIGGLLFEHLRSR